MIGSKIGKDLLIKILNKTCGFKLNYNYKDVFDGPLIELSAQEGVNYAQSLCGDGFDIGYYLSSSGEPVVLEIDHRIELYHKLVLDHFYDNEHIFHGNKFIIPLPYTKTGAINERNKNRKCNLMIEQAGLNFEICIITEINSSVKGNSLEHFTEYVASKLLVEEGFLVENQVNFAYLEPEIYLNGTPDIGAYRFPKLQEKLIDYKFINKGGFLCELATLRIFGKKKNTSSLRNNETQFIIGEAKTGPTGPKDFSKKEKYFYSGYFHRFLQITPHYSKISDWYDYIEFKEDGNVVYIPAINLKIAPGSEWKLKKLNEFENALIQKVKFYLLQNFEFEEFLELINTKVKSLNIFYKELKKLELNKICEYLENIL